MTWSTLPSLPLTMPHLPSLHRLPLPLLPSPHSPTPSPSLTSPPPHLTSPPPHLTSPHSLAKIRTPAGRRQSLEASRRQNVAIKHHFPGKWPQSSLAEAPLGREEEEEEEMKERGRGGNKAKREGREGGKEEGKERRGHIRRNNQIKDMERG